MFNNISTLQTSKNTPIGSKRQKKWLIIILFTSNPREPDSISYHKPTAGNYILYTLV
jgi:hypothetical protein